MGSVDSLQRGKREPWKGSGGMYSSVGIGRGSWRVNRGREGSVDGPRGSHLTFDWDWLYTNWRVCIESKEGGGTTHANN
ncbi:hypothetical protein Naga_100053g30 [Nannochloropsis gaditana]|uniref:Uncharacterized protein n=1 Tax=Nannochloropsis gaditana TaxID=72520 RepID=W7T8H1_9STRA|nr:hypothetical protein Naga_100053g30 [Nannochloropsis gaditana]